jgi:putative DNA primase/helicase
MTDNPATPSPPPVAERAPRAELHRGQLRFAERLADLYGERLRYAHGLGWYVWDNTRWKPDLDGYPTRAVIDCLKTALRQLAEMNDPSVRGELFKDVRHCESSAAQSGVLSIAGSLHPFAVAAAMLDTDPYLFNTPDGTLDLRTDNVHEHNPTDLITKIAGCGLDPESDPAPFEKFLTEILPDPEVRDFVQRLAGYAMLGRTPEHILPIFTGIGANGKSTLVGLLQQAFGDYAITTDPEMLVDKGSAHPTGQADLLGARLAVTHETDQGRRLAAATVKRLTGGESIRARRMRENFFEFEPSHTIIMVTNHKPKVDGDDPAMWRRIIVVPFTEVIPEEQRDPHLPDTLAMNLPAVLRWIHDGYRQYTLRGLDPPEVVRTTTEEYREASDALGRWIGERILATPAGQVKAHHLYTDWVEWCHSRGERPGTEKEFAESMQRRGYEKGKVHGVMTYKGIYLYATDSEEPPGQERYR